MHDFEFVSLPEWHSVINLKVVGEKWARREVAEVCVNTDKIPLWLSVWASTLYTPQN